MSLAPVTSTPESSSVERGSRRAPWVAGALGALVAFAGSWIPSLWTDEAATSYAASLSMTELRELTGNLDAVHGVWYAFMHGWVEVFGQSALALRMPSVLAVGVATAGVYVLGRLLGGARHAAFAAVIFALMPRVTWMGIEARSSALVTAVAVWLTVLLLTLLRGDRRRGLWAAYALGAAVLVALNVYAALAVLAHGVTVALIARPHLLRWLAASASGALLVSPLVWAAGGQGGQLGTPDDSLLTLGRQVVVNQYWLGETPTSLTGAGGGSAWEPAQWWMVSSVVLATVGWVLVVVAVRRGLRSPVGRQVLAWSLPAVVVPTTVLVSLAVAMSPSLYNSRYLAFSAPGVALLIGWALTTFGTRGRQWTAVALVVALTVPVYVSQRTPHAKSGADWEQAASFVEARRQDGDAVYFAPRDPTRSWPVARTMRFVAMAYPEAFDGLRDLTLRTPPTDTDDLTGLSASLAESQVRAEAGSRLWLIRRVGYPDADAERRLVEGWGFREASRREGPQTVVVEYQRATVE